MVFGKVIKKNIKIVTKKILKGAKIEYEGSCKL